MTLIEVMLVLAVMVLLAGVTVLSVQGMFNQRILLAAGDSLRGELAACRAEAMRTGTIQVTTLMPGTNRIVTVPYGSGGGAALLDSVAASTGDASQESYRFRSLPERVTFLGGVVATDARDLFVRSGQTASQAGGSGGSLGGTGQPTEIYFYPDGATSDAALYLQDDQGQVVLVTLRGLTGMTTVREIDPTSM